MGVPGFFKWLLQRYPLIVPQSCDFSHPIINNLYIDASSFLYRAFRSTNFNGPNLNDNLLAEIYRGLDSQVQTYKPIDLIFIAVDGVAPYAKAAEQRKRRFISASRLNSTAYDKCAFTPGTQIMYDIDVKLKEFIENQKKADSNWSKPRIIFSGVMVPGEAEHKIIDYIREYKQSSNYNPNLVHCLEADDADVIYLSLMMHEPNVILRKNNISRPRIEGKEKFEPFLCPGSPSTETLVYVSLIRDYFSIEFNVHGEELEKTLEDFVAFSFLFGNDFIPFIKDLEIYDSYDDIIDIYKQMKTDTYHYIENGEYNKTFMKEFFQKIVDKLVLNYGKSKGLQLSFDEVKTMYTKSNERFLEEKAQGLFESLDQLKNDMANSFLDVLNFAWKLYKEGCPSWRFYYPYLYSPPLEFVIPFIDDHQFHFEPDTPIQPLVELSALCPMKFLFLLPEAVQNLLKTAEFSQYFPTEILIDHDLRKRKFQMVHLIPVMDLTYLEKKFHEIKLPIDIQRTLNTFSNPIEIDQSNQIKEISLGHGKPFTTFCVAETKLPTFGDLRFDHELNFVENSTYPTLILTFHNDNLKIPNIFELLGQKVLINWPYVESGTIVQCMDEHYEFDLQTRTKTKTNTFDHIGIRKRYLREYGIDLGQISLMVTVSYKSNKLITNPYNYVLPLSFRLEPFDILKPNYKKNPNVHDEIIYVNDLNVHKGEIIGQKGELYNIRIKQCVYPVFRYQPTWATFQTVLQHVGGLSFKGLRYVLTEIKVNDINIAFTLFYSANKQHFIVAGCCRTYQDANGFWQYDFPDFVVPKLIQYFEYTGNLKQLIMKFLKKKEKGLSITLDQLYGGSVEYQNECFRNLTNWLSENSFAAKYPLIPCRHQMFPLESIQLFESTLCSHQSEEKLIEIQNVTENQLIWKLKHMKSTPINEINLGSRIVSIAESGPAPFGSFGIVIEISPESREVTILFDKELPLGSRFNGILSTNRALRMKTTEISVLCSPI